MDLDQILSCLWGAVGGMVLTVVAGLAWGKWIASCIS